MAVGPTSSRRLVLAGHDAVEAEERSLGGKAMGLLRLEKAGARVPPWCVIRSEAALEHSEAAGIIQPIRHALEQLAALPRIDSAARPRLEETSSNLRRLVLGLVPSEELRLELREAIAALGPGPYAVRSSMVGEDAASHSFAGQLESFLYQRTFDEVLASIVRCWASCYSPRALAYLHAAQALKDVPAVAVIVQQMVAGRVSGVLFTRDPVSGDLSRARVSACYGLCDGVVSGACATDEFVVDASGSEVKARVVTKETCILAASDKSGTREVEVPKEQQAARCLTHEEVTTIVAQGRDIAQTWGMPLDLEWTLEGNTLWFLQGRPITAVGAPGSDTPGVSSVGAEAGNATELASRASLACKGATEAASTAKSPSGECQGPRIVWDNSNIQESYCGVTTPLTFSFARTAYASVYEQFLRAVGVREDVIVAYRPVLRQLLGLVKGRVYYNINNWYRLLLVLPGFGRNKEDMERMMGLTHPVDFVEDQVLSPLEKLARVPRLLWTGITLKARFAFLDRDVARFVQHFERAYASVERHRFASMSFSELMETRARLEREILGNWHTPIINDLFVMQANGNLRRVVERAVGPEETPRCMSQLLGGEEGIESTEPARYLLRLAARARGDAALVATLSEGAPLDCLAEVRERFPDFAAAIDKYIERYGDRCIGELKLETVSLREDPSFVIHMLRNYLHRSDLDPERILEKERRERKEAEERVRSRLPLHERVRFASMCEAARRGVKHRENLRLLRTLGFGLYRDIHRAIGQRLFEAGRLDEPRDVFYLTIEEIEGYFNGTGVSADLRALARARKAEYAAYAREEIPHRFETRGPVHHGNDYASSIDEPVTPNARVLRGIGCYPGIVEAPAKIIMSPNDDLSLRGQILVTLRTDPGWAPLFPAAAGILVERGSTLSHSAVLARELGIPAVVGVPNLLKIVRDGERLRLNGATGTVERLDVRAP